MGLSEAVLLGFVFLLSGGNLRAAAFNSSASESPSRIPQEQVTSSSQLPQTPQTTDRQSNRTRHGNPVTYRLRLFQLRNPAVGQQKHLRPPVEASKLTSEQLESSEAVPARELLKLLVKGPVLNPPVKQESKALVKFEQRRRPVPAVSTAVRCGEGEVTIEVRQNFLGNGQLIRPSDLTLGGCAARDAAAAGDHILQFQTELQGCRSTLTMTEESLIYSFSLMYSPTPIGDTVILKTNPAEVVIECHYQRRHYVSSNAVRPTWKLFASNMLAEQQLHFSLRLMTEDWQEQRQSNVYFLSDMMHIEAAVTQGHHVPLRVYVDSCVATVTPDPQSRPRNPFVRNHGCLSAAKWTGSKSYFMQRSQEDKLNFQLEAFRFHQDHRNSLYITCHLTATRVSVPVNSRHKVCSFLTEADRWVASGGDNKVCSCCETSCRERRWKRGLAADADLQWQGTAALGPIRLEGDIGEEELTEPSELLPEAASLLQTHEVTRAASYSSMALLCGVGAAVAVALIVFMGAVTCSRLRKTTRYTTLGSLPEDEGGKQAV